MERFSAIRWCWGGAAASPTAGPVVEEREEEFSGKTTHWKPMLRTISEECSTPCVDSRRMPVKKRPVKAGTRSAAPARACPRTTPYCHAKDNWKSYTKITLPALSPTPFLF